MPELLIDRMLELIRWGVIFLYFFAAGALMLYGLNCYIMIRLFGRRRQAALSARREILENTGDLIKHEELPAVTTQIPVFNELNVVERVLRAVSRMHYPPDLHEIQVLDDSTDETRERIDALAEELRAQDRNVHVIRRSTREGYKAGALANGLKTARGELVAVFDADFVPPEDFLLQTLPFFLADDRVGLVQTRWGHLNRGRSLLTRAQSIGIDGHFMVEQAARNWNGLYMNFNGTAGLWRRQAIEDGGGWHWDTLTEDMDLSYRVQFAGWRAVYLPEVVVPAEIPEDVEAFKSQQFRWAKGSIQTALKLLPILARQPVPIFQKIQAIIHMTHYLVHPLMLTLSLLALPVLMILEIGPAPLLFGILATALVLSMTAPSALYVVSQRAAYPDWPRRLLALPFLVMVGVGLAVSNSRAVIEALVGRESGFVRTPKRGDREIKSYRIHLPWTSAVEIGLGMYCLVSLHIYLEAAKYLIGPFLGVYAAGFLFVGLLTLAQNLNLQR